MPASWSSVFGNDRPVEIEIGPGRGDVLIAFATAHPATNYFAIEHARGAAELLTAKIERAHVENVRVVAGDARCIVQHLVPAASVAAYHIYFPDPWPKRRHRQRRLFGGTFVRDVQRTLVPGGVVHVATDLGALFAEIARTLDEAGFVQSPDQVAPPRPQTRFERKYALAGTYAASFTVPREAAYGCSLAPPPSPSPQKNS